MMPPVSSPPSTVKSQPSSGPMFSNPRNTQFGAENTVAGPDLQLLLSVFADVHPPFASGTDQHLGGEVQVLVVDHPVAHARRTDLEAMWLSEIDRLVGVLRNAGPMKE